MGTVIQYPPRRHDDCYQHWERIARAELFERHSDLKAQGLSQRLAAQGA